MITLFNVEKIGTALAKADLGAGGVQIWILTKV